MDKMDLYGCHHAFDVGTGRPFYGAVSNSRGRKKPADISGIYPISLLLGCDDISLQSISIPGFRVLILQLSSIMLTRPTALGSVFKSLSLRALHTTRPALFLPTPELPPNPTSAEALGFAPQGDRKRLLPQDLKVDVPASANSNVSALKDARKVSALLPSIQKDHPLTWY